MNGLPIHPGMLIIGALQVLTDTGASVALTPANLTRALAAATDLYEVLEIRREPERVDGAAVTPVPPADSGRDTTDAELSVPAATVVASGRGCVGSFGPEAMWKRTDMRESLARRDMGEVFRIMSRYGIAQRAIGAATGLAQSDVSAIVNGRQVTAYDVLARMADGFGIARECLGLVSPASDRRLHLVSS